MFPLIDRLKDIYKKVPQDFEENPIDVVKRNIHVCGFWEEDFGALAGLLGDTQVMFGSDWPHPEGLARPADFADELAHVPEPSLRKIMGENMARLMKVPSVAV